VVELKLKKTYHQSKYILFIYLFIIIILYIIYILLIIIILTKQMHLFGRN